MFFLIPVGTDAPIYHWPYMTVALIVINTLVWFIDPSPNTFGLVYGDGLHPLQWITSNFMHSGFFHLLGNMIFLWGFGIIIEGKLGWWRYLLVYMGIGIVECMLEQIAMSRVGRPLWIAGDEFYGSVGASAVIYGLTAMSMVWAPKNEMNIFLFIFFFRIIATVFDMSIMGFVMFQVCWEILSASIYIMLGIGLISSSLLHLAGAALGFALAVLMLKLKWVDCEGWDLFNVMKGKHGRQPEATTYSTSFLEQDYSLDTSGSSSKKKKQKPKKNKKRKSPAMPPPLDPNDPDFDVEHEAEDISTKRTNRRSQSMKRVQELLDYGKPNAALTEYRSIRDHSGTLLPAPLLLELANALFKEQQWDDVTLLFEEYVERFPEIADGVRLRLSGILVEKQQRPMAALRLLQEIPPKSLNEKQENYRSEVERRANELIDEGVIELEGRSWR